MSDNSTSTDSAAAAASAAAEAAYEAYEQHLTDVYWKYSWEYPIDLWYLCTSVVGVAIVVNVFSLWWAWHRRHLLRRGALAQQRKAAGASSPDTEKASAPALGKSDWRNLPAAALAATRVAGFRWRIPHVSMTMMELILSVGYILAVFLFNFLNTVDLEIGLVESRAGDLATAQFPLIFQLAMKNNVIQFLTGLSHEKLNLMHRVLSRVMLLAIWIHWWGCVVRGTDMWGETWIWMGTMSAIAQTALTITSIKWVRKRWYEFFFITHVLGVVIFLVGGLWHVVYLEDYWQNYLWACVGIWGLDRTCRYLRYLILSSFHAPNKNPARVELLSDDTLRITTRRTFALPMRVGKSWEESKGWQAGQHMFVAFPTIGPIESHPFTVASYCEPLEDDPTGRERELMWIVRARGGLTGRLREHVIAKKGACNIPIFMDGPYGGPPDITGFETCVFVAGGSGVAFTNSRMREVLDQVSKRKACAKRVFFIWAIRHVEHINWISKDLAKAVATVAPDVELSIQIFVTSRPHSSNPEKLAAYLPHLPSAASPTSTAVSSPVSSPIAPTAGADIATETRPALGERPQSCSKSLSDDDKASTSTGTAGVDVDYIKGVDIHYGRPDMHALLEDIVTSANGAVSVDLSGPEGLVASVRSALSAPFAGPMAALRGGATVQLNVEDFTM